jgi:hypothetical protein
MRSNTVGGGAAFPVLSSAQRVAKLWTYRERVEHEAADQFARLAQGLAELGADSKIVALARRSALDEQRHAVLCRNLALEFDPDALFHTPHIGASLGPRHWSLTDQILYASVALCCVTETLSTALLIEMQGLAVHPGVRDTVHSILQDEITHSRIGWAYLADQARRRDVRWVSSHLPAMIAEAMGSEVTPACSKVEDLSGYGILPRTKSHTIMVRAVRDVVLPGLAGFGIAMGAPEV